MNGWTLYHTGLLASDRDPIELFTRDKHDNAESTGKSAGTVNGGPRHTLNRDEIRAARRLDREAGELMRRAEAGEITLVQTRNAETGHCDYWWREA